MSLPTHLILEIVTPDRAVVTEEVDEVQLPGTEGYLGILPGHTPLLTTLRVGQLWYRKGADTHYLSVAFGFAEVLPDRVRLLARIAERAEEIDITRAEEPAQGGSGTGGRQGRQQRRRLRSRPHLAPEGAHAPPGREPPQRPRGEPGQEAELTCLLSRHH